MNKIIITFFCFCLISTNSLYADEDNKDKIKKIDLKQIIDYSKPSKKIVAKSVADELALKSALKEDKKDFLFAHAEKSNISVGLDKPTINSTYSSHKGLFSEHSKLQNFMKGPRDFLDEAKHPTKTPNIGYHLPLSSDRMLRHRDSTVD